MSKILFLLIFSFYFSYAEVKWEYTNGINLTKDEVYEIIFDADGVSKKLLFRWTLFHNKGLVFLWNYDNFPSQTVLYTDYKRNGVKIPLFATLNSGNIPYFYIVFKEHKFRDFNAVFTYYLWTAGRNIAVVKERRVGYFEFK